MSQILADTFTTSSGPTDSAQVYAFKAWRFTGIPTVNTPFPGVIDAGPVTTGNAFGGPGQWQLAVVTNEPYYCAFVYNGQTSWKLYNSAQFTDENTGLISINGNLNGGINRGVNFADGVDPQDLATVSQIVPGPIGTQGPQGVQGSQGPQGTQGVQGAGYQGAQGVQGSQGYQGSSGPQGAQGYQGYQGPQGNQGQQGFQGTQGNQGSTGLQGLQGFQGNQGYQGDTGAQGFQGNQGSQGTQGFQGSQGFQGNVGSQGSQGVQGNQGYQGVPGNEYQTSSSNTLTIALGSTPLTVSTGLSYTVAQSAVIAYDASHYMIGEVTAYNSGSGALTVDVQYVFGSGTFTGWTVNLDGAVGATGSQGPQGVTGNQGNQGATGSQGSQGFQGTTGTQGSQGSTGAQGSQGFQGSTGSQGTQGFQGNQGSTGAQGNQGFQGFQGVAGAQGATGAQGAQGFQGTTGSQGNQGTQGNQGNQGLQGSQGATGASGSQGAQGSTGAQGVQGYQGATGVGQFWTPGAAGWQAWTFDPSTSGTTFGITKGAEYYMGFISPAAITLNSVSFVVTSAAVGPSNCYVGLYSQAGVLMATSADFSATLGTNTGLITVNISYAMTANTVYYLGLLIGNGTTTAPTVSAAAQTNTTTAANPGATTASGTLAGGARVLISASSTLTALQSPVSGTPATGNRLIWMGLK